MNRFLRKFAPLIKGVLSGFDRLVFRGLVRQFSYAEGLLGYLCHHGIRLKDFGDHAEAITEQVKQASLAEAQRLGREVRYLQDSQIRKDDLAREIAARDGIEWGLICILTAVEPCRSYDVVGNPQTHQIELRLRWRKCLHLYHYLIHPVFGFMSVRLQTWYPFTMQVCLNGREWLSRQLDHAEIAYLRRDNCFLDLGDLPAAQRLFRRQLDASWPSLLEGIVERTHPAAKRRFVLSAAEGRPRRLRYYWTVVQSEWATDVLFTSRAALQQLYPRLIRHGMTIHGPGDVLRFFGRKLNRDGSMPGTFRGEVTTDVKTRSEGVRIKHRLQGNSLKIYDKHLNLRFEMTMNHPQDFKVFRRKEGETEGPREWLPLRKGIADLKRRAEVSQAANERLMEAQAAVSDEQSLEELAATLCQPVRRPGRPRRNGPGRTRPRRFRALNVFGAQDAKLLKAIARPEFCQNGFRNRDLRALLYEKPGHSEEEKRRQSAAVTRQIALLRAHGLIHKIPRTHRYQVTPEGRRALTALLAARQASVEQLLQAAA